MLRTDYAYVLSQSIRAKDTEPPIAASIFLDAVRNASPHTQPKPAITELEAYFSGTNPCLDGDTLKWWKV